MGHGYSAPRLTPTGPAAASPFPAGVADHADISVIVPVLDEEDWLPTLLDSLSAQTMGVREVLVVDGGSTDGTCRIAEECGARALLGGGLPGVSRNAGAQWASGEWLLFLDADVRLPPTAVEEMWRQARQRGFTAASTAFVPDGDGWVVRAQHRLSSEYFWLSSLLGWPHSIGAFLFVRRDLHFEIGGFDTGILVAEDQDYVVRLRKAGRYAFTRHPRVEIAQRRFDREGFFRVSLKWIGIELHRLLFGEIRSDRFRYFG